MENTFIVINGFSTGADIIHELIMRLTNTQFVHIITQEMKAISARYNISLSKDSKYYDYEIFYDGDLTNLVRQLPKNNIIGIVCGIESYGVVLRDILAEQFNLANNDMKTLDCRINKFKMIERLKLNKVNYIPQAMIATSEDLYMALDSFNHYPLILKPLESGDSDGFRYCLTRDVVIEEFNQLYKSKTIFGNLIDKLLLQQFVSGKEYAINTVSYNGNRYVTDIWEYDTEFTANGLRRCYACSLIENIDPKLIEYTFQCLDALGYYYGAAHTEVIKCPDGQYYMVENNSRLMGGMSGNILDDCLKNTQLETLVTAIVQPESLKQMQFGVTKFIKLVNLLSKESGVVKEINNLDIIFNLNSYVDSHILVSPGAKVYDRNIKNRLAQVTLKSADLEVIEKDYQTLQEAIVDMFVIDE